MKKCALFGVLAILLSSSVFARFSKFITLTPANETNHGISVSVTQIKDDHFLIKFKWDNKDKQCWLIVFKDDKSVPDKLNFRTIIWRRSQELPPAVQQLSPLGGNDAGFVEIILEQSTISRTFVCIDLPQGTRDGGYYYTIDLSAYAKNIKAADTTNESK